MNLRRISRKLTECTHIFAARGQVSYSQSAEDLILSFLFQSLRKETPTYLEIGSNHPIVGNNTYYFYLRGSRGVCVEPDPALFSLVRSTRPRDICIQAGVGIGTAKTAEFYVFPHPYSGWNTFSRVEAEKRTNESGVRFSIIEGLPLLSINDLMRQRFKDVPDFISIDTEGLDLEILKSIDFKTYKPPIICAETIAFNVSNRAEKVSEIFDLMEIHGYFPYSDTFINTIFCRKDIYFNFKKE